MFTWSIKGRERERDCSHGPGFYGTVSKLVIQFISQVWLKKSPIGKFLRRFVKLWFFNVHFNPFCESVCIQEIAPFYRKILSKPLAISVLLALLRRKIYFSEHFSLLIKQVEPFLITSDQFQSFLKRHESVSTLVPESNLAMRNSYFILDEFMRFLDNTSGCKKPSPSILDVGVKEALKFSGFDEQMFFKRGGKYNWSKSDANLEW